MSAQRPTVRRCALYTRKSSEEGLEQSFNSLDAQREACEAYVKSQKAEGWRIIATPYDDGGYSGGGMQRPALQRLLSDITQGLVDIVVVYKIDRLTRSLADFARMVELFERHQVSFVSVTQSFNTTSSMGRLTLNVLLSFAQFEREVTGERIRDKIAASKRKGLWMGGCIPLGYDRAPGGVRTLVMNHAEAILVRDIFQRYLDLGSVHALARQLSAEGVTSKRAKLADGKTRGGVPFERGPLFHLLRNRLYLGEIGHRGEWFAGLHPPIIDHALFDAVQLKLDGQKRRTGRACTTVMHAKLAGRIFDAAGEPMSPTHSKGKNGGTYRYYVSASLQQGKKQSKADCKSGTHPRRIAATLIEEYLVSRLAPLLPEPPDDTAPKIFALIRKVTVMAASLIVTLPATCRDRLDHVLKPGEAVVSTANADRVKQGAKDFAATGRLLIRPGEVSAELDFALRSSRGRTEIRQGHHKTPRPDRHLVKALRASHALIARDRGGQPTLDAAPPHPYHQKLIRLAFLSPRIQSAILNGTQPDDLSVASLLDSELPLLWSEQERRIGLV